MACILEQFTSLENLKVILDWIKDNEPIEEKEDLTWNESWEDWEDDAMQVESEDTFNWISNCSVGLSPFGNILALGYKDKMAIFKAEGQISEMKSSCVWKEVICDSTSDSLTSLFILPLYYQHSGKVSNTWTNIVVGFQSGMIRFYSEDGHLLQEYNFCQSPVLSFSSNTLPLNGIKPNIPVTYHDDLSIQYENGCLVILKGKELYQILRICKANKAREVAGITDLAPLPDLDAKKYTFNDAKSLSALTYAGPVAFSTLDALVDKSQTGGFNIKFPEIISVQLSQVLAGGMSPFYAQLEIRSETDLNDRMTLSEMGGLLQSGIVESVINITGFSSYWKAPKLPVDKKAEDLPIRYALCDSRRICSSIVLSPSGRLAALVDEFGRVIVLDVHKSLVTRMWKGYRNAQCAWQTCDGEFQGRRRRITFLLIYAPNRGILEIWLPQSDKRAGAFNVPKDARLIYNRHTMLECDKSLLGTDRLLYNGELYQAVFLTNDGIMKKVKIPMLFGFRDIASLTDQDLHLVKDVRIALRHNEISTFFKLVALLKTADMKLEVLTLIMNPEVTSEDITRQVLDMFNTSDQDCDHKAYKRAIKTVSQILKFYSSIKENREKNIEEIDSSHLMKRLSCYLMMDDDSTKDMLNIMNVDACEVISDYSYNEFLSCISYPPFDSLIESDTTPLRISVKNSHQGSRFLHFLFDRSCSSSENFITCINIIVDHKLNLEDLSDFFFKMVRYSNDLGLQSLLTNANIILFLSVFIEGRPSIILSDFWTSIQKELYTWQGPIRTFVLACICRGIEANYRSYYLDEEIPRPECVSKDDLTIFMDIFEIINSGNAPSICFNEFEGLSRHLVEWSVLTEKLDKLKVLHKLVLEEDQNIDLSVSNVFEKGPGYISEIVAKFFIRKDFDLSTYIVYGNIDGHDNLTDILFKLEELFPHSMNKDALRVNYVWELSVEWGKNISNVCTLTNMVKELCYIEDDHIKQGLCSLLWHTRFKIHLHYVATLISSTDNLAPYEFDEMVLPEDCIAPFLEQIRKIYGTLMAAIDLCLTYPEKPELVNDTFWKEGGNFQKSLSELTLMEPLIDTETALLHVQLILALHLAFNADIKLHDISLLFSELSREYLFGPLSIEYEPGTAKPANALQKRRRAFFDDVINSLHSKIPINDVKLSNPHIDNAVQLSKEWFKTDDIVLEYHAVELLSSGSDTAAFEVINFMDDMGIVPKQMLLTAMQRLHFLIHNASCGTHVRAVFTISTQKTLSELKSNRKLRKPQCSLESISTLLEHVMKYTTTDSDEYSMAKNLFSSLESITNTRISKTIKNEMNTN